MNLNILPTHSYSYREHRKSGSDCKHTVANYLCVESTTSRFENSWVSSPKKNKGTQHAVLHKQTPKLMQFHILAYVVKQLNLFSLRFVSWGFPYAV